MSLDEKRFFQADLTTNLFVWLKFSQSIDQIIELNDSNPDDSLANKVDRMFVESTLVSHIGLILGVAGLLFGVVSVSGIVGYSNTQPANLWFVLALFACWPLLTAILSFFSDKRQRSSLILQSLLSWVKRSQYLPIPESTSISSTQLLLRWVSWRWQLFSIGFVSGSLIGFFVIITFWDISFGWSSTLANSQKWMEPLIYVITWPSHGWLGAPSEVLMNASQLSRYNPTLDAELLRQWWPYVLFSIFVYGLMSRVILLFWKYYRLKSAIIGDIRTTRVIERYRSMQAEQRSVFTPLAEVKDDSALVLTGNFVDLTNQLLFGWQFNHPTIQVDYNFGAEPWKVDLNWLATFAWAETAADAVILVNVHQTPVIELIDLVDHIQKISPSQRINIGIYVGNQDKQNGKRFESTWQQFAQKHPQLTFTRYAEALK